MNVSFLNLRTPIGLCFSLGFSRQAGDPGSLDANLIAEEAHHFGAPDARVHRCGNSREALLAPGEELIAGGENALARLGTEDAEQADPEAEAVFGSNFVFGIVAQAAD